MDRARAGRRVADAGGHVIVLSASTLRNHLYAGPDAVAIALRPFKRDVEPMAGAIASIHPDLRVTRQRRDYDIHPPVAVQIPKCASPVSPRRSGAQARLFG